jgi:hypothetical protein
MKKVLLTGVAALFLTIGAAHAIEYQGNLSKPVQKLPAYPPIVCVAPNWATESCQERQETSTGEDDPLLGLYKFLADLSRIERMLEQSWLKSASYERPVLNSSPWPRTKTVLYEEPGGVLQEHERRWIMLAATGNEVEIRGPCMSACTMIMAYIPKERLCFGDYASLQFHLARNSTSEINLITSQYMVNSYPQNIRDWLMARGGVAKMTTDYWSLDAEELWDMGYRKCAYEPAPLMAPVGTIAAYPLPPWTTPVTAKEVQRNIDKKREDLYRDWNANRGTGWPLKERLESYE